MDEESIESSEPIYELASECEKLFSKHISKLKDGADLNGSKVVGEYQQRFSAWAAFWGVFAAPEMSFDRRLQRHVEIQDLALRLLDIMKRNLTYLFESENTPDGENVEVASDEDSSPQPQLRISIESLRGIEGAIERLHHLGSTLQLSSEASQATRLGKFAAKFDSTSFEEVAQLAIRSFYPDASPSLTEHLARAMTDMYQLFHYRRSRQVRLQPRPQLQLSTISEEPASQLKTSTFEFDPPPAPPPIKDIHKRLTRPIVMSHLGARSHQSKDSKPTSLDSKEFKKLFPQRKDGSVKSKTRSIAASLVAYPQPSEKSPVCDWCFSPLSEDELKGDKWKMHLNKDFNPFFCLSEKCIEPLKRFATSRAWFSHMLETHGQNWHREVHLPAWWICPLCNNQETTYPKSQDLSEHMSKLHGDVFTEQQIQIIVHQSRLRAPRPQDVCPLCCLSMKDEQDSDEGDQVLKRHFRKLSVQGEQFSESSKRIKTETGSVQLDQRNYVNAKATEQPTSQSQVPILQSQGLLNAEKIARHVATHMQGIMLFSLRMMALDAVPNKPTDDKTLSGDTDDDLSRLGSNQQRSLPQTQETEGSNDLSAQDENMDIDDPLLEDTIPDCEHNMNWQEFIPNSEPLPEADTFLQQVIDSGAFQGKEGSLTHKAVVQNVPYNKPKTVRPRTPPATIIMFRFRHDPDFTGHDAILSELVNECSTPPARLALVGMGGIGKTHLAIELAYRLVTLAKTSIFWVNAESQSSINQRFETIAANVSQLSQRNTVEASLQISSDWLSQERNGPWVMILDGANDHSIFHDERYLPKSQQGTIIITTRRKDVAYRLTGNQQDVIEIGPMPVFESVNLLEKKLGRTAKEWFPKNGAASGLVKSLGLIPLAICRAAAYIQSISPKLHAKDNDGSLSHLPNARKSFLRRHQSEEYAMGILRTALKGLSPKTSPHGYSPPPTVGSLEEDILDDTFMYEGDEETQPVDHSHGHEANDNDDSDDITFQDEMLDSSEEEKTAEERAEEKTALLHVEEQLVQLRDSEDSKLRLLEFEVFNPDRSGQIPKSLFRTWKSSFDAIRFQSPSAAGLLSLMSFFDRRGIPKWLFRPFRRGDGAQRMNILTIQADADDEVDSTLNNDIEILMNHCLITSNGTRQMFEMHGLVQLAVKKSLDASLRTAFEWHFIKRLAVAFPAPTYANWESWGTREELFAHVQVAANCQPSDEVLKDWQSLLHNGGRFARLQGRYEIAMLLADKAYIVREKLGVDDMKTLTLTTLLFMDQGQYDIAEELFTQISEACRIDNPEISDIRTGTSMNNLASIYKVKGKWAEAEDIQSRVEIAREGHLGPNHPRTLTSKANLASTYRAQGRYIRAERLQEEVVEGYRNRFGPDHPLTLINMNNLGSIYRLRGKLSEAESLQSQAMQSLSVKLGADHPDTLICMNCLASTYRAQGFLDQAKALQERVLEMRRTKLGPDHPHTLASMNNLALIYSDQGNYLDAAELQSRVLEICKVKLGPEHPHTLTSLHNIALMWKASGREGEGKRKLDECLEARRRVIGNYHPYTYSSRDAEIKWLASA